MYACAPEVVFPRNEENERLWKRLFRLCFLVRGVPACPLIVENALADAGSMGFKFGDDVENAESESERLGRRRPRGVVGAVALPESFVTNIGLPMTVLRSNVDDDRRCGDMAGNMGEERDCLILGVVSIGEDIL